MALVFTILIFIGIGLVIFFAIYFSAKARLRRELKKIPVKRINQVTEGETVRVVGNTREYDQTLTAPLSGRKCVYYQVIVEQHKSSGKSSYWKTIITEERAVDFIVDQGGHKAFVKMGVFKGLLDMDASFRSGFLNDASDVLENYLNNNGFDSTNILGLNKSIRYKEGVLEPGEDVAVKGTGRWQKAANFLSNSSMVNILVLDGTNESPVLVSDEDKCLQ